MTILWVALGGALGSVARYLVGRLVTAPWGTLTVNVVGSLVIGLLAGGLVRSSGNDAALRAFAVVGVCGGFTTFSTFANESFAMLERGHWTLLAGYLFLSIGVGLAAVGLGYRLARS